MISVGLSSEQHSVLNEISATLPSPLIAEFWLQVAEPLARTDLSDAAVRAVAIALRDRMLKVYGARPGK
jgi:hypothetical protein